MSPASGTVPGGCQCGAVRFEVTLPSRFCAHCHCRNCRRAHGAAFVTYAGFPQQQLRFTAGEERLTKHRTGTGAERWFCSRCGSTLVYAGPRWPDELHVVLAGLEGEIDRPPSGHYYVDHKASWHEITDGLPQFGGSDGTEPKQPR